MSATESMVALHALAAEMDTQRAQLKLQFAPKPRPPEPSSATADQHAMQPYQPRSMLMRLLVANPQILKSLVTLVATGVVGVRGAPWLLRAFALFVSLRKK